MCSTCWMWDSACVPVLQLNRLDTLVLWYLAHGYARDSLCTLYTADALMRADKPCRVLALINDSVGVLTASCYFDQATEMGVILGTGTNACIVDQVGTGSFRTTLCSTNSVTSLTTSHQRNRV